MLRSRSSDTVGSDPTPRPVVAREANVTCYYASPIEPGRDWVIRWEDAEGHGHTFQAEDRSLRLAEIEASAWLVGPDGMRRNLVKLGGTRWAGPEPGGGSRYARLVRPGRWRESPHAPYGLGNLGNPLVPWTHCAADPRFHPYASRIFAPGLAGWVAPDGFQHEGWLWVADTGDAIKGAFRLDWMVGTRDRYLRLERRLRRGRMIVTPEPPPRLPPRLDPLSAHGVQQILIGLGYRIGSAGPRADGVDGLIGPRTLGALRRFQARHPEIPALERGRVFGAVSTWFLATAAQ